MTLDKSHPVLMSESGESEPATGASLSSWTPSPLPHRTPRCRTGGFANKPASAAIRVSTVCSSPP
ncbi:hypothetical protein [Lysobacter gummosus]|uniref:hypothetical protein n=1 Tax=Lysobacter gummosus TaxID=262324 RepID=UPI00362E6320